MATRGVQTRQLGNSDMQITPVGFGAWAIGGAGWEFAWGDQDDQQSIEAIHRALDLGVNWIDTAAVYGLGHSEEVVARALAGRAHRPYIFTKCALIWDERRAIGHSLKADSVRGECEASLRRLKTDTVEEGKIRYIGVSNFNRCQMERAMKIAPITSLQPPYSAIERNVALEILPFCQEHNIGVIVYSPMQSGLLTGAMSKARVANFPDDDWRKRDQEFQEPRLSRNLALADIFKKIGARHGRAAGEGAIAWTLCHPAVTAAIVGARNARQVNGIIGAMAFRLSQDEINKVENWVRANP